MIPSPGIRTRSLRTRLLVIGGGAATAAIIALVGVGSVALRTQDTLTAATAVVIEEQQIADRVITGVMRQLATISAATSGDQPLLREEFDAAGTVVVDGLRAYLFRELSIDERVQLEQVREEHNRMEISAVSASQLGARGDASSRAQLQLEAVGHARSLLNALDGFLRLREADLENLAARQSELLRRLTLIGGGLLFVIGGIMSWLLVRFTQRRITEPLARLGEVVSRIGEGDLGSRLAETGDTEFRTLAVSVNRMAAQLARTQSDLEARHRALEEALVEVQRTQADLLEAEKLGAVGRMTAGLAHELNNPLASVLGVGTLLEAELHERGTIPTDELQERFVGPLVREATRARLLVRSLLQFSRRAGGTVGPVPLREALAVVVELRRHAFDLAGVRLAVEELPDVHVVAEPQQLQAIFLNLLNNALHALTGRGGGTLRIRAEREATGVVLQFADDGPGLAEPERIFEPFYTTKQVGEGTGLGLALSRGFVESFGGALRAANRPEGGACFTLRLLLAEPAPVTPSPAREAMPQGGMRDRTVLVVDDEPELRDLAARAIRRLGATVLVAGDVPAAQAHILGQRVDAIVSDLRMPGESGLDLLRWVARERPALSRRFLIVTGDVSDPELLAISAARPEAVILKPFDLHEYLRRIRALLD